MPYLNNEEFAKILTALEESSSPYAKEILELEHLPVLHHIADTIPEEHLFDVVSMGPHSFQVDNFFIRNGISYAVCFDPEQPSYLSVSEYDLPEGPYLVERNRRADTFEISE